MPGTLLIQHADSGFCDWGCILELIQSAFAYQADRIDPPSSASRLNVCSLAEKAAQEHLILAKVGGEIVGCVFVKRNQGSTYIGKLAVKPNLHGKGIGRKLMDAAETRAIEDGSPVLELETRIELIENHETFGKLGFVKVSEGTHEGYDHPTFITMQKRLRLT